MDQNVFGVALRCVALQRLVNRGRVVSPFHVFVDRVIDGLVLNCI